MISLKGKFASLAEDRNRKNYLGGRILKPHGGKAST